jgi:hypothetical protein
MFAGVCASCPSGYGKKTNGAWHTLCSLHNSTSTNNDRGDRKWQAILLALVLGSCLAALVICAIVHCGLLPSSEQAYQTQQPPLIFGSLGGRLGQMSIVPDWGVDGSGMKGVSNGGGKDEGNQMPSPVRQDHVQLSSLIQSPPQSAITLRSVGDKLACTVGTGDDVSLYRELLRMSLADGRLAAAENAQLEEARHAYNISWEQHHQLLNELTSSAGVVHVSDATSGAHEHFAVEIEDDSTDEGKQATARLVSPVPPSPLPPLRPVSLAPFSPFRQPDLHTPNKSTTMDAYHGRRHSGASERADCRRARAGGNGCRAVSLLAINGPGWWA